MEPNQRWRLRKASYRDLGKDFDPSRYDVLELKDDTTARTFVETHHYSGSYPAARFRFGLYGPSGLEGVAVYSHPCNDAVLTTPFGAPALAHVELGRFVLLDEVPGCGESWFGARTMEMLRGRIRGVISHSDDFPRTTASGEVVFAGHLGTIYQALNAVYQGRCRPRWIRLLPDGRIFSERAESKIARMKKGWRYAVQQLVDAGAAPFTGVPEEWLARELPRITRRFKHPGNHRYLFGTDRRVRRRLPASLPYPKAA